MILTSRERVRMALNHEEPDKIPIDFGGMRSSGISAIGYNKLKKHLKMTDGATKVYDVFQQLAEPEEKLMKRMGADVIQLHRLRPTFGLDIREWKESILQDGSNCRVPKDFNPITNKDEGLDIVKDGTVIARMPKDGFYFDQIHHPYADVQTKEDIDKIPMEKITDEELEYLRKTAKILYEKTDYAILGAFGGNILESGQIDWGYERFYMELALNPELVHYYLQKLTDVYLYNLEKYLNAVGQYIDIIQFGDDLGTQENLQLSVNMYREMIKPYHKAQFQYVQQNYPNVKVLFHSCGAIYNIIPDLIDAGVQALNPIQLSAKGMDPVKLKEEFGKDLVFWGGGVDTQQTVTSGTVEDIQNEVKQQIEIFASGGGFVFTQVHNIQSDIEPEKVLAIYDSAIKFRDYSTLKKND